MLSRAIAPVVGDATIPRRWGLFVIIPGLQLVGREHPIIAVAGLAALVGLVGFYAWVGMLLLQGRIDAG